MEEEKNELLNAYLSCASMLGEGTIPSDLKPAGVNKQGFPILESKEQGFSMSWFVFNMGAGPAFTDDYPDPFPTSFLPKKTPNNNDK